MNKVNDYLKIKLIATFLILFISFSLNAQNWNVFNKSYRYNYIYDNNALITNVLFIDSLRNIGADTLYLMNRIGVECNGTCPTITTAITTTANVIIPNMPQFLQRTIIKYANGLVMLKDTAKLVIKPTCTLNETWLFDSINNKNATCINTSTQTIFSLTDSVKTILIDGTDTLKLSKKFGIVQFPNLYNKNKYYRLVGIENSNACDQLSLYGLKVPNAWDFYDFNVGDKFCFEDYSHVVPGPSSASWSWKTESIEILSKTVLPGIGYDYTIQKKTQQNSTGLSIPPTSSFTNTITTLSYDFSIPYYSAYFRLYPGKLNIPWNFQLNIVKFGFDNNNKFYAYSGHNCTTYTNISMPNANAPSSFRLLSSGFHAQTSGYNVSDVYATGLGNITRWNKTDGYEMRHCTTFAKKNGSTYFGEEVYVGIEENNKIESSVSVYPNPATDDVYINSINKPCKIEVLNSTGELVLVAEVNESLTTKLNLKEISAGIYFIKIYNQTGLTGVKKLIKE